MTDEQKKALPLQVSPETADKWKADYGRFHMTRVAGVRFICRALAFQEMAAIQKAQPEGGNEEALARAVTAKAQLYVEDPECKAAGFDAGRYHAVAGASEAYQGEIIAWNEESRAKWPEFAKDYKIEADALPKLDPAEKAWLFLGANWLALLVPVSRADYEAISQKKIENKNLAFTAASILWPATSAEQLAAMPYGRVDRLYEHSQLVSGFVPEAPVEF